MVLLIRPPPPSRISRRFLQPGGPVLAIPVFYRPTRLQEGKININPRAPAKAVAQHRKILRLSRPGDVVVLPSFSCVGTLVPVLAVLVARSVMIVPETGRALPEHLKDIVLVWGEPVTGLSSPGSLLSISVISISPRYPGLPRSGPPTPPARSDRDSRLNPGIYRSVLGHHRCPPRFYQRSSGDFSQYALC